MSKVLWVVIYALSCQTVVYANEFTYATKSEYDSQPNTPSAQEENIDQFTTGMPPSKNKTKAKVNLTQLDEEKLSEYSIQSNQPALSKANLELTEGEYLNPETLRVDTPDASPGVRNVNLGNRNFGRWESPEKLRLLE